MVLSKFYLFARDLRQSMNIPYHIQQAFKLQQRLYFSTFELYEYHLSLMISNIK